MQSTIFYISFWLFFLGLGFSAFYVFPSGNPQPADFMLAVASLGVVFSRIPRLQGLGLIWPMIALATWVAVVSFGWSILYPSDSFNLPPIYYAFNCLVVIAVVQVFYRLDRPVTQFVAAVQLALLVSGLGVFFSLFFPDVLLARQSSRITGFFNNPNQLAYYNICMLAVLLILKQGRLTNRFFELLAIASGIIGIIAASSFGAIAGLFFIFAAIIVGNSNNTRKFMKVVWSVIVLVSLVGAFDFYAGGEIAHRLESRLGSLDRKIDQLDVERGYDRILAHPQYWLVGAAEGATERFRGHKDSEIHSSFGNMLFAYGFVGLGLFLFLLWKSLLFAPLYAWLCLAAPLTYSLTHMGLRSTTFWFLIAVMLVYFGCSRSAFRDSSKDRVWHSKGARAAPLCGLGSVRLPVKNLE